MADAKMLGKQRMLERIRSIPAVARVAAEKPLEEEVGAMEAALKRAAPVGHPLEAHPGELRDKIEMYRNPDRPLSWRIIAGARDAAGRLYTRFVEFGHGAAAPVPFWWPTYRANIKRLRTKCYAATRKALQALFAS